MARILALTSRVPWPPREGHQLRSYHVLDALASQHKVHLLSCLRQDDEPDAPSELRAKLAGFEAFAIPAEKSRAELAGALARGIATRTPFVVAKYRIAAMQRRIAELAGEYDLVHVDMLPLIAQLTGIERQVPVVLNAHNVEHALLAARVEVEPRVAARAFLRTQISKLQQFEQAACRRASAILACSEDDAAQLRRLAPTTFVQVVPNGVDLQHNQPDDNAAVNLSQLVFVGQMGWFPNRDGVEWFLAEIMPRILEQRRDARFVVVGKAGGLKVPDALRDHVQLTGFVDDVRRPDRKSTRLNFSH